MDVAEGVKENVMKGLYLLWADHIYIDKALAAGIDTLIVPFYSLPDDVNDGGYFPTFDQAKDVFVRYKGKVRLIASPVLYQFWASLPKDEMFVQNGVYFPRHICPTSETHIDRFMAPFVKLHSQGLIDEVMPDVEHYTGEPKIYNDKIRCECPRCAPLSHEDQWKHRAMLMKKYPYVTGQMAHDSWWSLNCYSQKKVLSENTYSESGIGKRLQMWSVKRLAKSHDCNMTIIPGAFIEMFRSTDKFIGYLGYLQSHCPYEGYWIYTQKMFSRWSKLPQSEIDSLSKGNGGFYETRLVDEVDPGFFSKLRALNG